MGIRIPGLGQFLDGRNKEGAADFGFLATIGGIIGLNLKMSTDANKAAYLHRFYIPF